MGRCSKCSKCSKCPKKNHCRKPEPWHNITVTKGFRYIFNSGAELRLQKDQFALIATPHRCVRGNTLRQCDGFQLLQLDTGNGNIVQPIDVERLLNGENPIDSYYSGFTPEQRAKVDAAVQAKIGTDRKYVITSFVSSPQNDVLTFTTTCESVVCMEESDVIVPK